MTNNKEESPNLFHTVHQTNEYTFYFDQELGPAENYRDLSMILVQANEGDVVNLMINGPGGYVDTAAQLSNLISSCQGTVIGHLLGPSASAYCTIFLSCHGWVVHPHATLMAHQFSGGFCEKGAEIKKAYESYSTFVENMMLDIYYPFFSIEEIEEILHENKNIYLTSKEITERIEKLAKHREEQYRNANS